ncbi:HNH endonuclease signature motif containing protein [Cryobacterium arcticum]|uniref:HNH nuclease domain-containing protein n=1 Tax=Cryobacterium arcticum TaxID=670052 RepID=A0A317ZRM3_9MICO|nr:HNH endonuclease signature motif containing protein [Cryobacterium arcticum]PXA67703.1 hypothetical protein CTB96_13455 [Cryobacterium arcticum]
MSSPSVAPPPAPDDDVPSPKPTRHDRVLAELARKTELVAAEDRAIARAQARKVERLVELQAWSEKAGVAQELHGTSPATVLADRDAPLTATQARAAAFARWDDKEVARRTIISETACLTNVAERTVDRLMDEARFLYYYAPATFDALAAGEISYRHANTMVDQVRTLPDEDQAAFEEQLLPAAKTMPVGRFLEKARRLRERLHPESIVTRATTAVAARRTYWEADYDGMAWLHWYGTAEQTKAAFDRITSMATSLKKLGDPIPPSDTPANDTPASDGTRDAFGQATGQTGTGQTEQAGHTGKTGNNGQSGQPGVTAAEALVTEKRGLDQLRADVTAALLLDGITTTGLGTGIAGTVMLTVTAETLLGRSDEPAILEGYGPISPEAARKIAGDVPGFTRLLTHPETGVVLSLGKDQYRNTQAMKKWLRMRDETCRFPGCSRPAVRCDMDHTNDWADGGPTDHDNLACLCEAHHRLKHLSQWQVTQQPGGILLRTSPGKRSYRTDPANQMSPPPPAPPVAQPKTRKKPAADTCLTPKHQPPRQPSPPLPDTPPF